jgi:SAM-dependent methyltransferase
MVGARPRDRGDAPRTSPPLTGAGRSAPAAEGGRRSRAKSRRSRSFARDTAVVVDRLFSEARLAESYDLWNPWGRRGDFGFYLPLVMSAGAVLDIGCGTGQLLRRARETGHAGRLCGLDPADAMLAQARTRPDIEWTLGDLASVAWDRSSTSSS